MGILTQILGLRGASQTMAGQDRGAVAEVLPDRAVPDRAVPDRAVAAVVIDLIPL